MLPSTTATSYDPLHWSAGQPVRDLRLPLVNAEEEVYEEGISAKMRLREKRRRSGRRRNGISAKMRLREKRRRSGRGRGRRGM